VKPRGKEIIRELSFEIKHLAPGNNRETSTGLHGIAVLYLNVLQCGWRTGVRGTGRGMH
jgi:hypothetical protein